MITLLHIGFGPPKMGTCSRDITVKTVGMFTDPSDVRRTVEHVAIDSGGICIACETPPTVYVNGEAREE